MINITIRAHGKTVAEALTRARAIAAIDPRLSVILDGIVRPIYRGDIEMGSMCATGNDADKLAHYTKKDARYHHDPRAVPEAGF